LFGEGSRVFGIKRKELDGAESLPSLGKEKYAFNFGAHRRLLRKTTSMGFITSPAITLEGKEKEICH